MYTTCIQYKYNIFANNCLTNLRRPIQIVCNISKKVVLRTPPPTTTPAGLSHARAYRSVSTGRVVPCASLQDR